MGRKSIVELIVLILVIAAGLWAVANQQTIRDWWVLRNYEAPEEIAAISEQVGFSDHGERLFYASQPELNDREAFNQNCAFPDKSLVLGCYSQQRIYIFDVEDERLDGVEEVTAAHEMLHAAYDRLSSSERERIDGLVEDAFDSIENERILEAAQNYEEDGHGTFSNELHSILGTEAADLPEELERHYGRFFDERTVIVSVAESYEAVFNEIQDQIADYDQRIENLRQRIDETEQTLTSEQAELEQEASRLQSLRDNGQTEAYNQAVPGYNSAVDTYNDRISTYITLVERHNRLVNERNQLAVEQNSLVHSLDSRFQPIED